MVCEQCYRALQSGVPWGEPPSKVCSSRCPWSGVDFGQTVTQAPSPQACLGGWAPRHHGSYRPLFHSGKWFFFFLIFPPNPFLTFSNYSKASIPNLATRARPLGVQKSNHRAAGSSWQGGRVPLQPGSLHSHHVGSSLCPGFTQLKLRMWAGLRSWHCARCIGRLFWKWSSVTGLLWFHNLAW